MYRGKKKAVGKWCNLIDAAIKVQKSVYAQTAAVLPLLIAYFGEKENKMMKVYEVSNYSLTVYVVI